MSAFEPLRFTPTNLAEAAKAVALADVMMKVVDSRRRQLRDGPLADKAREAATLTGSDGLTSRIDGVGQVILTAPQPKPKVSDRDAFAGWLDGVGRDDLYAVRWTTVIVDAVAADALVEAAHSGGYTEPELRGLIERALVARDEVLVDDDVFDVLTAAGAVKVGQYIVFDTATGERVPGTSVSTAAQQVSVRVAKQARAAVTVQVREALGLGADS